MGEWIRLGPSLHGDARSDSAADTHPTRPMVFAWAIAFLACLVVFGLIASVATRPEVPNIDFATTAFLHALANPTLDALMNTATLLGSSPVLAVLVALAVVVLVGRERRVAEALFLVGAFIGSLVLNDGLKLFFHRPRPGFDWAQAWPETSFPSGHSMDSFVVCVALALIIWRLAGRRAGTVAVAVAALFIASVGISRIYLGAHWLSDVLGGYLAGAAWLLLLVAVAAVISRLHVGDRPGAAPGDGEARRAQS